MLADRKATGDNEATPAALAAVLQRLASRRIPGIADATVEDIRRAILAKDDPRRGRVFSKEGDLASDPITCVRTGWCEKPGVGAIVFVVMLARDEPRCRDPRRGPSRTRRHRRSADRGPARPHRTRSRGVAGQPGSCPCRRAGGPRTPPIRRPGRRNCPGRATSRSASRPAGSTPSPPTSGPIRCSTGSKAMSWRAATTWRRRLRVLRRRALCRGVRRVQDQDRHRRGPERTEVSWDMPSSAVRSPSTASTPSRPRKELTTHLEVFRWYCPESKKTEVLILRSPRAFKEDDRGLEDD